jgi:hypothetical protein
MGPGSGPDPQHWVKGALFIFPVTGIGTLPSFLASCYYFRLDLSL